MRYRVRAMGNSLMTDDRTLVSKSVAGITVSAIKEMAMRAAKIPDAA